MRPGAILCTERKYAGWRWGEHQLAIRLTKLTESINRDD